MKAIRSQARREMEAERSAMEQMKLNEQLEVGLREVHLEGAPMLAVQGVYFHCPLIGLSFRIILVEVIPLFCLIYHTYFK